MTTRLLNKKLTEKKTQTPTINNKRNNLPLRVMLPLHIGVKNFQQFFNNFWYNFVEVRDKSLLTILFHIWNKCLGKAIVLQQNQNF